VKKKGEKDMIPLKLHRSQPKDFRILKTLNSISPKNKIKIELTQQPSLEKLEKFKPQTTDPSPKYMSNAFYLHRIYDRPNNSFTNSSQSFYQITPSFEENKNKKGRKLLKSTVIPTKLQIKTDREGQSSFGAESLKKLDVTSSKEKDIKKRNANNEKHALTTRESFPLKEKSKGKGSPICRLFKVSALKIKFIKSIYAPVAMK